MGNVKCGECGEETKSEDVFRHQGKPYCSECTVKHLKDEHSREIKGRPADTSTMEDVKAKHGPEGRRAHTYTSY